MPINWEDLRDIYREEEEAANDKQVRQELQRQRLEIEREKLALKRQQLEQQQAPPKPKGGGVFITAMIIQGLLIIASVITFLAILRHY